jgi:hypothetical protein
MHEGPLEPREIVQAAIDAYHAHDPDSCLGYYAPDVVKDADGNLLAAAVRHRLVAVEARELGRDFEQVAQHLRREK